MSAPEEHPLAALTRLALVAAEAPAGSVVAEFAAPVAYALDELARLGEVLAAAQQERNDNAAERDTYRVVFGEERSRANHAEREAHRLDQQVTQLMVELAENRAAHQADHEALAAFQRASGCPDGVTLAAVLRERNALVRDLRDVGTCATPHNYEGDCPDVQLGGPEHADDRVAACKACRVLSRADAALVGSHRGDA